MTVREVAGHLLARGGKRSIEGVAAIDWPLDSISGAIPIIFSRYKGVGCQQNLKCLFDSGFGWRATWSAEIHPSIIPESPPFAGSAALETRTPNRLRIFQLGMLAP